MTKEEARNEMKQKRKQISEKQKKEWDQKILLNLLSTNVVSKNRALYTYVSYNHEVDTVALIEYALAHSIKVAVPKVEGSEINFYYISSMNEVAPGYQKIPEPTTNETVVEAEDAVVIMPGLCFDVHGNRVGYGGGFYDRYLKKVSGNKTTIALAYDVQVIASIESELHDTPVEWVITPTQIRTKLLG